MNSVVAYARTVRNRLLRVKPFVCPEHLSANHRTLSEAEELNLILSLRTNYFSYTTYFPDPPDVYFATDVGRDDLNAHIYGRLDVYRQTVIPWIDNTIRLHGARVLEIGCGTGASTVALAEQGAEVIATDVHEGSLRAARDRLSLYGLDVDLSCSNAEDTFKSLRGARFDVVAFLAVLEHMTLQERLQALHAAWKLLPSGGCLVVQETPNRLWYFDVHTAQDYFFLWLPDDLAIRYAARTPRERYNRAFQNVNYELDSTKVEFARWGRGVSYHDFEMALDLPAHELPVVSCLELFVRNTTGAERLGRRTLPRRFEAMLSEMSPRVHRGFCLPYLDLIFRKP